MNTKMKLATYNARGAQSAGAFARLVWHIECYGKRNDVHVWLVAYCPHPNPTLTGRALTISTVQVISAA